MLHFYKHRTWASQRSPVSCRIHSVQLLIKRSGIIFHNFKSLSMFFLPGLFFAQMIKLTQQQTEFYSSACSLPKKMIHHISSSGALGLPWGCLARRKAVSVFIIAHYRSHFNTRNCLLASQRLNSPFQCEWLYKTTRLLIGMILYLFPRADSTSTLV